MRALRALLLVAVLAPASPAVAVIANVYLDPNGINQAGCGLSTSILPSATSPACRSMTGLLTAGCATGAAGCADEIGPATVITAAAGTYSAPWWFTGSGTLANPILLNATGAILDGATICAANPGKPVLGVGFNPTSGNPGSAAGTQFWKITGLRINNAGQCNGANFSSTNIKLIDTYTDNSPIASPSQTTRLTLLRPTMTNCPVTNNGCTFLSTSSGLAVVGAMNGPLSTFPDDDVARSIDCLLFQNTQFGLIDGGTFQGCTDGIDVGMTSGQGLANTIIRNNIVYNMRGQTGQNTRQFKHSGDFPTVTFAEKTLIAGNLFLNGKFSTASGSAATGPALTELARNIDFWGNTVVGPSKDLWIVGFSGSGGASLPAQNYNLGIVGNVFSNTFTPTNPIDMHREANQVANQCQGSSCPFDYNFFYYPNGTASQTCVAWEPSDETLTNYACSTAALGSNASAENGTFNSGQTENTGNAFIDPQLVNIADTGASGNVASFVPAAGSRSLDVAPFYCVATSTGTASTTTVTCGPPAGSVTGLNDATIYFPDPTKFYLDNDDCKSTGTRTFAGANYGCFDIQIEGCGVRTITAITPTTITWSGGTCALTSGTTHIHTPYSGAAPDIGLERNQGATATPTPTVTRTPTPTATFVGPTASRTVSASDLCGMRVGALIQAVLCAAQPTPGAPTVTATPTSTAATATPTVTITATPTLTPTSKPSPAADWCASGATTGACVASWNMESATNANQTNDGGTGSSTLDLTHSGSTTKDTTTGHFAQGTAAVLIDGSGLGQYLTLTDSGCGGASCALDFTGPFTVGCWERTTSLATERYVLGKSNLSTNGYSLKISTAGDLQFFLGDGTSLGQVAAQGGTAIAINTLRHVMARYSGGEIQTFLDATPGATTRTRGIGVDSASDFFVGTLGTSAQKWDGNLDECVAFSGVNGALSNNYISRVYSCGVHGEQCACDSGAQASYLSCNTNADCGTTAICSGTGGTCRGRDTNAALTLPACNTAAP